MIVFSWKELVKACSPENVCINFFSCPSWTHRGGKATNFAFWRIFKFFWPLHKDCWKSPFWANQHFLWLQWKRPRGQRRVMWTLNTFLWISNTSNWKSDLRLISPNSLYREIQAGAKLSLNRQFFDERWSKHRVVSCLDWSSQVKQNASSKQLTL